MSEEMRIIMNRLDELDAIKEKLNGIEVKMEERFDNMEERFDNMEERFDNMEGRFVMLEKLNHQEHNMIIEYIEERIGEESNKLAGKTDSRVINRFIRSTP